jgi:hypothetical protein
LYYNLVCTYSRTVFFFFYRFKYHVYKNQENNRSVYLSLSSSFVPDFVLIIPLFFPQNLQICLIGNIGLVYLYYFLVNTSTPSKRALAQTLCFLSSGNVIMKPYGLCSMSSTKKYYSLVYIF